MGKHGGKRANAGRKPKVEEQQLIETLSPFHDAAIEQFEAAVTAGKDWAIKLYLEYYYGKPKQAVDLGGGITFTAIERHIIDDTED